MLHGPTGIFGWYGLSNSIVDTEQETHTEEIYSFSVIPPATNFDRNTPSGYGNFVWLGNGALNIEI